MINYEKWRELYQERAGILEHDATDIYTTKNMASAQTSIELLIQFKEEENPSYEEIKKFNAFITKKDK